MKQSDGFKDVDIFTEIVRTHNFLRWYDVTILNPYIPIF